MKLSIYSHPTLLVTLILLGTGTTTFGMEHTPDPELIKTSYRVSLKKNNVAVPATGAIFTVQCNREEKPVSVSCAKNVLITCGVTLPVAIALGCIRLLWEAL